MKIITHDGASDLPVTNRTHVAKYTQFSTRYDSENNAIWCWMHPEPRPCMNDRLVHELAQLQHQLTDTYQNQPPDTLLPLQYIVLASKTPGIYNLGGDLQLIKQYIATRQEEKLRDYAYKATDLVYKNINNLDLPVTMVSLVQGQALGAGFEAALSCDVIVAERHSQLCFPEILFNMFPGMGAYNLLVRRIGPALAERLILSGKTYSAGELYEMGVIDVLAEDDEGVEAVVKYMQNYNRSGNTTGAIKKVRQTVNPITRRDLYSIVDIWLEAAMALDKKDLARMERLLYLQEQTKNTSATQQKDASLIQRRSDWRKIRNIDFPLKTHLGETVLQDRRKNPDRRKPSASTYI